MSGAGSNIMTGIGMTAPIRSKHSAAHTEIMRERKANGGKGGKKSSSSSSSTASNAGDVQMSQEAM